MTIKLDLNSLQPTYDQILSFPGKQLVTQYVLHNDAPETITTATQGILALLSNHPPLCATFSTQPQEHLETEIKTKKFLVINGNVVCLSDEKKAPISAPKNFVDRFFSLSLLKNPVACIKNHYLEQTYLPFWIAKHGNVCPGGDHPIVSTETDINLNAQYLFKIDEELQWYIDNFRKEKLQHANALSTQKHHIIEQYRNFAFDCYVDLDPVVLL